MATLERYEEESRRTMGGTFEKIRAVLSLYCSPVGRLNPTSCVYAKSRTFMFEVRDILERTASGGLEDLIRVLNEQFRTATTKSRIKIDGDFDRAMRAISRTIPHAHIDITSPGDLLEIEMAASSGGGSGRAAVHARDFEGSGFSFDGLPLDIQRQFLEHHRRLLLVLTVPEIKESDVDLIQSECSRVVGYSFTDLINFNAQDDGETALHACVQASSSDGFATARKVMGSLIALGANVNAQNKLGRTPVLKAAILENVVLATELHKKFGADITIASDLDHDTGDLPSHYMDFSAEKARPVDLDSRLTDASKKPVSTNASTSLVWHSTPAMRTVVSSFRRFERSNSSLSV